MPRGRPQKTGENFWNYVNKTDDGCWTWQADLNTGGYGRLSVNGRLTQAHRYAYELVNGPIPAGHVLWHTCRNPQCVRPDHLEHITPREQSLRNRRANSPEKFWSQVCKTDNGCWEWQGLTNNHGYGILTIRGRRVMAHRHAYTLTNGTIPAGLVLDHRCRNPRCVRPDHLEPVTQKVNVQRGESHWRNLTYCKNGHPFTPENTYRRGNARHCRQCTRDRIARYRSRLRSTPPDAA